MMEQSNQQRPLDGRVCVVTGGTRGLGRAIAQGLARAGASVVVGSRDEAGVAEAVAELTALGAEAGGFPLDVADAASVHHFFAAVHSRFGRIDGLVTAAGITKRVPIFDLSLDDWERILRVNLTGTFLCCQAAGRIMRDQPPDSRNVRGAIVTIASIASYLALAETTAYGCSKAAVVALTKNLANDWASLGIRVNAIAPGVFPTDLNRPLITGTPRGDWFIAHTPLGRFGDADELAGAAVFLLGPTASYVTGETLAVDGGFLARGVGV